MINYINFFIHIKLKLRNPLYMTTKNVPKTYESRIDARPEGKEG